MPRLKSGGPVVYAAMAQEDGAKEVLAARLLEALAKQAPKWGALAAKGPPVLDTGPLGQPLLRLSGQPGPSISFSETGGLLWAALAAGGRVGVDAALEEDFAPPYPYSRTFQPGEWDWAWRHCDGKTTAAAALLWAVKEAAVKALGVGFHKIAPQNLEVGAPSPYHDGLLLSVQTPGETVSAWTRPLPHGWLALAVA